MCFLVFWLKANALGLSHEYGTFIPIHDGNNYALKFIVDPGAGKFAKFQEVSMTDYGNDGKGDMVILLYRNGSKEVFFRDEYEFRRYVAGESVSKSVCGGDWSSTIKYLAHINEWHCAKINFLYEFVLWWGIDRGLVEAKNGDWQSLSERILQGAEKLKK
ncbi:MAG: hypothetical protein HYT94_05385 [Parcubacteria group bacterium]|nr:hypothetical protein [Parcubacteria group bacterium]